MAKQTIEQQIHDPKGIWYGPHQCNDCGKIIIKKAREQGGLELNAPFNSNYPNHVWQKHSCK